MVTARAITVAVLITSTLSAVQARAAPPLRVSLVVIYDDTARASVSKLRRELTRALSKNRALELVSHRPILEAAKSQRLAVDQWLSAQFLSELSTEMRLDAALGARLFKRGRGYEVSLLAVAPTTGEEIGKASLRVKKPALLQAQATRLIRSLAAKLQKANIDPQPQETAPVEEIEAPPSDEAWGSDLAFEEIDETTAAEQQVVEVRARIGIEHFSYPVELKKHKVAGRDSTEVELSVQSTGEKARGYASLLFRRDFAEPARDRQDINEAYAEVNTGSLNLRAGRIIAAWGTASLVNPTDILNPVDSRDPIDPIKHGTWMIRLGWVTGPVLFEAYYLPVPEAHLVAFPSQIDEQSQLQGPSRWVKGRLDAPTTIPLRYTIGEQQAPAPSPTNSQAAVRIAASGFGLDASLAYAYLFDHFPSIRPTITPDGPIPTYADVDVQFEYPRQHVVTADMESAFGKFRIASEAAVVFTGDMEAANDEIDDPYATAVAGIDYRTAQFLHDHTLHFFVDLTVTRAVVGKLADDDIGRLRYPFKTAALGRIAWEMGEDLVLELNAIGALDRFDLMVLPHLEYIFYDRVKVGIGYAALFGTEEGFFGRFERNSRAMLSLEVKL